MANSPVPVGEVFAGKYRVDRVLGEGGMGIVVAAHHLELDQPVAIKFLLDDLAGNQEGAERFRREARAAAKIQSDHVVRVLDVGVLPAGERYMVMEYLKGHDLAEEIERAGRMPFERAVNFLVEALDAVGHAHAVGIIHRDLKPANLFLAERPDGTVRVKVLDFGISKTVGVATTSELSLTKTSAWIGSPLYMSPEQMQSARDVDQRADIWSLGAIFYEMLSGQPPYLAESLPQLCNLLLTRDPQPIRELVPEIPEEVARVVMACLDRDVNRRISSTAEIAERLAPFAGPHVNARLSRLPRPSSAALDRTEMGIPSDLAAARTPSAAMTPPLGSPALPLETVSGHARSLSQSGRPEGKGWRVPAILGAVAALAGLGFFLMRPGAPPPEMATSGSKASGSLAQSPVAPPAETQGAAKPPVEAKEETGAESASASASAGSVSPNAPAAPSKAAAQPAKAKARTSVPKPDDLSDFGGRR